MPVEKEYTIGEREDEGVDISILTEAPANAAFIHKVTGAPLDVDNCVRLIEGLLGRATWMHPTHVALYKASDDPGSRDTTADLTTSAITTGMALILDWIGDQLPESVTARMKEELRSRGTDEILDNIRRGVYWSTWYISNWCSDLMMGLAVGSAYEKESDPRADEKLGEAAARTRRFLDAQGADGGYHEGIGYSGAVIQAIVTSLALEHAGKPSLLDHPYFDMFGDFVMHGMCPGFAGLANFNDASYPLYPMAHLSFLARRRNRGDWQWAARNIFEKTTSTHRWDLLWFDPEMPEEKPSLEKRARLFTNTHFAFVRDSWEDDARYLVVPAGSLSFGHRHSDLGGFLLNEFGERQIADSGTHYYYTEQPWHVQTRAHSTLLIDGEGVPWDETTKLIIERIAPEAYGPYYSLIDRFDTNGSADVIVENLNQAYCDSCDRFFRTFVSLHGGPVVLIDDIRVKAEKAGAELELRFIATGSAETAHNTFIISHERSRCRGEVLLPGDAALSLAGEQEEVSHGHFEPATLIPVRVRHKLEESETAARFVTLIWPHLRGSQPEYEASVRSEPGALSCRITTEGGDWELIMQNGAIAVTSRMTGVLSVVPNAAATGGISSAR